VTVATLRAVISQRVALPRPPAMTRATVRTADGERCVACRAPIRRGHTAYMLLLGGCIHVALHAACYRAWLGIVPLDGACG
jgi:hypothetical protein